MSRTKPQTLAETIRQKLADEILQGVHPPGTRLDEIGLAKRFKLSRTPVREALRQLTSAGLVDMRPRRGVIVSLPSDTALAEMFEVMGELEASCARLAARRMSPSERVRLELVHGRAREAVRNGDRNTYRLLNFEFHDVIYQGAHNAFLLTTTLGIRQRIAPYRRAQFAMQDRLRKSHEEHEAIVEAILAGDAKTASEVMRSHVSVVRAASSDYVHELEAAGVNPGSKADHDAEKQRTAISSAGPEPTPGEPSAHDETSKEVIF